MRAATQQSQKERKEKAKERNDQSILDMTQGDPEVDANNLINRAILKKAIGWRGKARLCGNLSPFERHVESVQTGKKPCVVINVIQCADCATSSLTFSQTEARTWGRVAAPRITMIASSAWL